MNEEMTWVYNNREKLNHIELLMLGDFNFFDRVEDDNWYMSSYSAIRLTALVRVIYQNYMSNN